MILPIARSDRSTPSYSRGAFTYDEIMNRIPWCVVLTMISDQGRMRKKKEREEVLQSEEEELEFFGLK